MRADEGQQVAALEADVGSPQEEADELLQGRADRLVHEEMLEELYTQEDVIGEGTYGKVWKGQSGREGTVVAIKQVKLLQRREQEGFPHQAIREMRALRRLRHPNVVKLMDVCSAPGTAGPGTAYVILEYVPHDLQGFFRYRKQDLRLPEVKCLAWQMLKGLEHCHALGVIHRDLKPANLLLSAQGDLKICDFGLSREFPSRTGSYSSNVITLWYRPPEVLLLAPNYDEGVDVWSAGCIVGELLTGRPLFPESSDIAVFRTICKKCQGSRTPGGPPQAWPESIRQLPRWQKWMPQKQVEPEGAEDLWNLLRRKHGGNSADMVYRMMEWDPSARISASNVLRHTFFEEAPRRCEPSGIKVPEKAAWNELAVKKQQAQLEAQRQAAAAARRTGPAGGAERPPAPAPAAEQQRRGGIGAGPSIETAGQVEEQLDRAILAVQQAVQNRGTAEWLRDLSAVFQGLCATAPVLREIAERYGWASGKFASAPDPFRMLRELKSAKQQASLRAATKRSAPGTESSGAAAVRAAGVAAEARDAKRRAVPPAAFAS